MKRERTDLLVGGLALGTVVTVAAVLIWLSSAFRFETYPLYTHYAELGGLAHDAPVLLRGFEVGRVGQIEPELTPQGMLLFRVRLDVRRQLRSGERLPIPAGTVAMLRPPAMIGSATVELVLPDTGGTVLDPGATLAGRSEPPLVQQASQLGRSLAFDVGTTLEALRTLLDSLTLTATAATRLTTASALRVPAAVGRLDSLLLETHQLSAELRRQLVTLTPAMTATTDSIQRLLHESTTLVTRVNGTVGDAQPMVSAILANLESTTLVLDHLTRQLARSPVRTALTGVKLPARDTLAPEK